MRDAARFFLIDAFSGRPFAGEPLVVIDDESLSEDALAGFAGEFGPATLVALRPASDPVNSASLRLFPANARENSRPAALVAAATLLAQRRAPEILARESLVVSLEWGEKAHFCEVIRNRRGVCYAEFALAPPGDADPEVDRARLAAALDVSAAEIGFERHAPRRIGPGPLVVAPFASREALARAAPAAAFAELFGGEAEVLAYARADPDAEIAVEARLFGAQGARPASGRALGAFAAAAVEFERPEDGDHEIFLDLVDDASRRARVTLRLIVAQGALDSARCGGQAAIVASGELNA